MPTKLSDTRDHINTLDEARTVFNAIAMLKILNEKILAQAEAQIAKIKEKATARIEVECADLPELEAQLARYIETHKDQFQKPRKISTNFGTFGLQKACKVEVTSKKKCLDFLTGNEMEDCLKFTTSIDKSGLKPHLEAGEEIPGAELKQGDIAHYTVKKALIEEAQNTK